MSKTGSEYIAMAKHTGPPESGADSPADPSADNPHGDLGQDRGQGFDDDVDPASVSPPARFGRLALWIASASALTVGVVVTVAYGVWFDQDQRTYAKAMAAAQQTLSARAAGVPAQQPLLAGTALVPEQQTLSPSAATLSPSAAAAPTPQTAWSGHVAAASPPSAPLTTLADAGEADLTTSASPAQPESTDVAPPDSVAPHSSIGQPVTVSHGAKQDCHHPAPRLKPNKGLFARMGSFFHRVSYRQHGNGSQRDLYAHS
jgi:hypothetical protein